jgi:uncharacterized DUF497 family protein
VPGRHRRFKAIGEVADGTVLVIAVDRGSEALSIISMRPAGTNERSLI